MGGREGSIPGYISCTSSRFASQHAYLLDTTWCTHVIFMITRTLMLFSSFFSFFFFLVDFIPSLIYSSMNFPNLSLILINILSDPFLPRCLTVASHIALYFPSSFHNDLYIQINVLLILLLAFLASLSPFYTHSSLSSIPLFLNAFSSQPP